MHASIHQPTIEIARRLSGGSIALECIDNKGSTITLFFENSRAMLEFLHSCRKHMNYVT